MQYRDKNRSIARSARKKVLDADVDEPLEFEPKSKKGKKKQVYGVINMKYYVVDSRKSSLEALKQAGKVKNFEERELIFSTNRAALMTLMRYLSAYFTYSSMSYLGITLDMCQEYAMVFFDNPRHLEAHFFHLSEVNITKKVGRVLVGHLGI